MYLSFGRSLCKLGKVRIGVGFRMKGWTAGIMIFLYGMFYLCWYMMLGMLWLIYGMGYLFIYLPIKGIIKLSKKKKEAPTPPKSTQAPQQSTTTTPTTSSPPPQSSPTEDPNQKEPKNKSIIIFCWVCMGVFLMMALTALSPLSVGGFFGALLFLLAAVIITPMAVIEDLRRKFKINRVVSIVLAFVLFVAGALITPTTDTSTPDKEDSVIVTEATEKTSKTNSHILSNSGSPEKESTTTGNNKPQSSTTKASTQDPSTETVYYTATGSKYHSRRTCSGLSNAKNIYSTELENAKNKGLGPCSKCN